jgi:hypothetical protein
MQVVLRHLVHDPKNCVIQSAKRLQVPRRETAGRLAAQLAKALSQVRILSAERGYSVASQLDFPRAEDPGIVQQRGAEAVFRALKVDTRQQALSTAATVLSLFVDPLQ